MEELPEFDGARERASDMLEALQQRLGPSLGPGSEADTSQMLDFTITMSRVSCEAMHRLAREALIDETLWGEEITPELVAQHLTVYANYIEALTDVLEREATKKDG